jgi:sulfatase maturation enzyme AslB (radical SAM superfamily)
MLKLDEIHHVQIELTTRCNARCPMCMRNYRGFDFNSGYPLTELTLDQIKQILQPDFLKQLTQGVTFNGNLGDFGLAKDALEIVEYLSDNNVKVHVNTNGSMRSPSWWAKLAQYQVRIGFALDGLADTHGLYRQDTDWYKVIENAQAFIDADGEAVWRFIPFDHNRHQEEACKNLAKTMGFKKFENINDGRNRGPVYKRNGEFSHHLGLPYDTDNPRPDIKPLLESHVTWFDHRTVQSEKDIQPLNLVCQHVRMKELYITADGHVFPCCFLGYYPDTMNHPGNTQLRPLIKKNNALEYSLENCTEWFDSIEATWKKNTIAEGRLYACVNNCSDKKPFTVTDLS